MRAIQALLTRRSIRQFTGEKIDDDSIKVLLECAMNGPSAGNEQPWHFLVIDDKEILNFIPTIHPFSKMLPKASHAIVVCGDVRLERYKEYWVQDCSCASENILLAAHALGFGACWLGVHPYPERIEPLIKLLKLPEYILPLNIIAVGVPDEYKTPITRFNPERIHKNNW